MRAKGDGGVIWSADALRRLNSLSFILFAAFALPAWKARIFLIRCLVTLLIFFLQSSSYPTLRVSSFLGINWSCGLLHSTILSLVDASDRQLLPPPMKKLSRLWPWRRPPFRVIHLFVLLFAVPGFFNRRSGCADGSGASDLPGQRSSKALPAAGATQFSYFGDGKAAWGRSLLAATSETAAHDTAAIAFLDGTIYLLDSTTGTLYGSFSSGSQLSTSYQAFDTTESESELGQPEVSCSLSSDRYFISPGDDWNLYEHSKEFGKKRLDMTIEDYVESTPRISMDGGITLGSKKSTMFLVDLKKGKIISSRWSADNPQATDTQDQQDQLALFDSQTEMWAQKNPGAIPPVLITRTDYTINHFVNSSKPQWGMTVSVVEASSCQVFKEDLPLLSGHDLGWKYDGFMKQCNVMIPVHRIHGIDPLKHGLVSSSRISLPETPKKPLLAASPTDNHHKMNQLPRITYRELNSLPEDQSLPSASENSKEVNFSNGASVLSNQAGPTGRPHAFQRYFGWFLFPVVLVFIVLYYVKENYPVKFGKQSDKPDKQSTPNKKKKGRKSGISNGSIPSERDAVGGDPKQDMDELMSFSKIDENSKGRRIGKLFLSNVEIAKGSNGTVVLEGIYDGRPVAVKRLVRAHHDVAFKEIENLIASDQHSNIVRWFGVEYDTDFVYIALERCVCSLNDLILLYSDTPQTQKAECSLNLKCISEDVELWKSDGSPAPQLLKIMRDVVSGLAHLHELGIIHRDIKPQNVLIIVKNRCLSAKLSDMGISKRLAQDMSSLGHHATGSGSSGWQAPEQLLHGRQTRAIDLFSLGCVLFFCITKGRHPFGSHYERDSNILNRRVDLFLVDHIPEAVHLFSILLDHDPEKRPRAAEVLQHPLFWSSEMRLSFLRDASDRVELEDRENDSELLRALESIGPVAFGGKWVDKCEAPLLMDISRYRRYRFDSTRDLLRVIRNKLNHYMELPKPLQDLLGSVPDGFDQYFSARFPRLLMEVYNVMYGHCRDDDSFRKYFKNTES